MTTDRHNRIVLEADAVRKAFGGTVALSDGSLRLRAGEIHALVGANGAGKSTLIKICSGALQADGGRLLLNGVETVLPSPHHAQRRGIATVYQEFSLVNTLAVAENIYLGRLTDVGSPCIDWSKVEREAAESLKRLGADIDPKTKVRRLSVADRQIVEITKALSTDPKVLILDEPTSSLTSDDVERLFGVLRRLAAGGISILYVSHRLEELPQIASAVTVFRNGRFVVELPIAEASKRTIIRHMVGTAPDPERKAGRRRGARLLSVRNFSDGERFHDISFDLYGGEILGITGLAGAGRTELARALFGADKRRSGTVSIDGTAVKIDSPRDAIRHGLGLVTEDRKEQGLVLSHSIAANTVLTVLHKIASAIPFLLSRGKENAIVHDLLARLAVVSAGAKQRVRQLSGGNQQKIVVAKWLATHPRILIMDEPTRGIDVGAKGQMYTLLNELAENGIAILMISSEIPEILEMSDRLIVMSQGRISAVEENVEHLTEETVLSYATAHITHGTARGDDTTNTRGEIAGG